MLFAELEKKWAAGEAFTADEAMAVLQTSDDQLPELLALTKKIHDKTFGDVVDCCSIVNAKSGLCSEDCSFCAQSAHHATNVETYDLKKGDEIVAAREEFPEGVEGRFSVVTSGHSLPDDEVELLCEMMRKSPGKRVKWCSSLGILKKDQLVKLKEAGLTRYHHNLETAKSNFTAICTTHEYDDRIQTIRDAKKAGLDVCCGGLFGIGESLEQRVELALAIRDLKIDSIPLNFLVAVEGTPVTAVAEKMSEPAILRTIAMFRLLNPTTELLFGGGRDVYMKEFEDQMFAAGITGILVGGYLTVRGRSVQQDLDLIKDTGYKTRLEK